MWYHSGDLLRVDALGFFYFVDRAGDSYRWKGENVSTNDVCETLGKVVGCAEANVYGVSVPGCAGKTGMLSVLPQALTANPQALLTRLLAHAHNELPSYAVPRFVRIRASENDKTGTLKFQKFNYVQQGFDPAKASGDQLFFWNGEKGGGEYVPLTQALYVRISTGDLRVN
jgi:fatty-acyl-CoA synthase